MGTIHKTNYEALQEILSVYSKPGALILDMTFGTGAFWRGGQPSVSLDIVTRADVRASFYGLPFLGGVFDVVVFDPPYRMNGTRADYATTKRYKNKESNYRVVPKHYAAGVKEAHRVLRGGGLLVVKMQDQVVSGKRYFQTNMMLKWAKDYSRMVDEVHVVTSSRPQPAGRAKRHLSAEHSTFQVWLK